MKDIKRLITHVSVDMDAIMSLWFTLRFILKLKRDDQYPEIIFVPANWSGADMQNGDLILDVSANGLGIKGKIDKDGRVHSCVKELFDKYADKATRKILHQLVKLADMHDSCGSTRDSYFSGISPDQKYHFESIFQNWIYQRLVNGQDDMTVCLRIFETLDAFVIVMNNRAKATKEIIESIVRVGKVALYIKKNGDLDISVKSVIFGAGFEAYVYIDGFDLGVVLSDALIERGVRADHPRMRSMVEKSDEEWFAHSSGSLYCWGSRKSPRKEESGVDPYFLARELDMIIKEIK